MKIYLAIPYSFDPQRSFEIANKVASDLMSKGNVVISPISHSHPIADYLPDELRTDSEWWMKQDLPLLEFADEIHVICINDEETKSKGIQLELEHARKLNKPIKFIEWSEFITHTNYGKIG